MAARLRRRHLSPRLATARIFSSTNGSAGPDHTGGRLSEGRATCGNPVLGRTRQGLKMAEILKSFRPRYEISYGRVKLRLVTRAVRYPLKQMGYQSRRSWLSVRWFGDP
jgi:hypothetical protein